MQSIPPFGWLSRFWRQVATLGSGTLLAQAMVIGATPILSRLYLPEDFGISGAYLAVVISLTVVVNGGYEMAIMLPEEEEKAHALVNLCLSLAIFFSLILLVLGWIVGPLLLDIAKLEDLKVWHLLLPFSLVLEGFYQPVSILFNRKQKYQSLAISKIVKTVIQVALGISLGLLGFGFSGLLLAYISGQLGGTLFLLIPYIQDGGFQQAHPWKFFQRLGKEYRDFPTYAVASNWLNTAGKQLPQFLLPGYYSKEVAGFFQQTQKLLSLPIGLLGGAVGSVFYKDATAAYSAGDTEALRSLTWRTSKSLFWLGMGPSLLVLVFGPELFGLFLGENWIESGIYARYLMPWMWMMFIASPLSYLVDVFRKLGVFLLYNLLFFLVQLSVLEWGHTNLEAREGVMLFGFTAFVLTLMQLAYLLYLGMNRKHLARAGEKGAASGE